MGMKVDKSKWEKKTLGEVCIFKRGLTYPKSEECHVPSSNIVLRSNNIDLDTYSLVFSDLKYLSDTYEIPSEKKIVKDSILMCMSNGSSAHIGKVAFIDREYDCAFGGFMGLIIPHHVFPKYLYYNYRSKSFKDFLLKIGNGINITNLKFSSISPYPILIPNFEIQQSIASELDAIQTMIDGYKAQLDDLDDLAKSIFLDMFGDPVTNPKGWEKHKLGDKCEVSSSKRVLVKDMVKEGIPFIRGTELALLSKNTSFDNSIFSLFITREKYEEVKAITGIPRLNDLLIPSINPYGYVWKVNTEEPLYFKDGRVIWIHLNNSFDSDCLRFILESEIKEKYSKLTGAVFAELTLVFLRNLSIIVPPLPLQQQFAAKIEAIETQKEKYKAQLADAEQLMAERMQYYFS